MFNASLNNKCYILALEHFQYIFVNSALAKNLRAV